MSLQCLSKEGSAVEFIGGGPSILLAAGGRCPAGNLSFWDIAAPPGQSCIARLSHHKKTVVALEAAPGGWLLLAGDSDGALSATDIRMLSSNSGGGSTNSPPTAVLWSVRASRGSVHSISVLRRATSATSPSDGSGLVAITGGHDGAIRAWQASTGKLLQSVDAAHPKPRRLSLEGIAASAGGFGSSGGAGAAVTGVEVCEEGIVSCGADGSVRLHALV